MTMEDAMAEVMTPEMAKAARKAEREELARIREMWAEMDAFEHTSAVAGCIVAPIGKGEKTMLPGATIRTVTPEVVPDKSHLGDILREQLWGIEDFQAMMARPEETRMPASELVEYYSASLGTNPLKLTTAQTAQLEFNRFWLNIAVAESLDRWIVQVVTKNRRTPDGVNPYVHILDMCCMVLDKYDVSAHEARKYLKDTMSVARETGHGTMFRALDHTIDILKAPTLDHFRAGTRNMATIFAALTDMEAEKAATVSGYTYRRRALLSPTLGISARRMAMAYLLCTVSAIYGAGPERVRVEW